MARKLLIGAGGLLLILNAGAFFCPDPQLKAGIEIASCVLGLSVSVLAAKTSEQPTSVQQPPVKQNVSVAPEPVVIPAPAPAPARAEAEIVAFLALLQEHGRLVDFVREDASTASDVQLGAAARVVHSGCRKVLSDYFEITPVHSGNEGDSIILENGYDSAAHRLLGTVSQQPPYKGKLLHPGWLARSVKLPRVTGTTEQRPWPVLAPAEVEVSG